MADASTGSGGPISLVYSWATAAKERLFADPSRPNSYAAGGLDQTATPYDVAQLSKQVQKTATKTSLSNTVPAYVPKAYVGWVQSAAAGTGLPASIVAAQIDDESGFDPNAVSDAGAEGIAQFEPATWKTNAPSGTSPFDPTASNAAYIKLMGSLLTQYGGNIRKALAAYNAGSGNLSAGYGYADSILAAAGAPRTATAGGSSGYGGTRPGGQPSTGGDSGSGSGGDDTGQGVTTLFTDYETTLDTPRTESDFVSPSSGGWTTPFQWWWQSFSGNFQNEQEANSSGS